MGFLGSVHCVGMCGPIALAVGAGGGKQALPRRFHLQKLVYHLGRTFTYSLLGLLIGLLGFSLFLAGMQQSLSLLAGFSLLLMAFFYKRSERLASQGMAFRFVQKLRGQLAHHLRQGGYRAHFFTGVLNGLLPCGMVYLALLAAFALQAPLEAAAYMAAFGLGTSPLLLALMLGGHLLPMLWRERLNRAIPYMAVLIGLLFVLRGLGLGHFLSPALPTQAPAVGVEMTLCGGM